MSEHARRPAPHTYTIAAALVRRGDEILLVREQGPDDPEPKWTLPGGGAEPGELLHETLARELREETGLDLVRLGSLISIGQTYIKRGLARGDIGAEPQEQTAIACIFEVAAWQGELPEHVVDPDGLVTEVRFFAIPAALALLDRLTYRPMREPIVAYLRGEVAPGALWLYRSDAGDADTQVVLRLP